MSSLSRLKRHLTYANVMATTAAFLALGGGAYAVTTAPRNSVRSSSIKNRNVKNPDIATGAVTASKLRSGSVTTSKIANGAVDDSKLQAVYQFGNGQNSSLSGELAFTGDSGPIALFNGSVQLNCSAAPTLTYGDLSGDPSGTELWFNGVHQTVPDGGGTTPADIVLTANGTDRIQIAGSSFAGITDTIVLSNFETGTQCEFGGSVQSNF